MQHRSDPATSERQSPLMLSRWCLIKSADRRHCAAVAVADEAGLTSMGFAGGTAQASSLAEIGDKKLYDHLHADERKGKRVVPQKRVVPIMPMRVVLDSLRDDLTLWFLKTDMQGFDYRGALKPAGERLKKIHYVNSETFLLGVSGYSGVSNDYCQDTLPLMLSLGFEPVALLTWWSLKTDERIKYDSPSCQGASSIYSTMACARPSPKQTAITRAFLRAACRSARLRRARTAAARPPSSRRRTRRRSRRAPARRTPSSAVPTRHCPLRPC